jgi:hypothetical protein
MVTYRLLAELVVVLHGAYVGFVVLGLATTLIGILLRWTWVRNFYFRAAHFAAVALISVEAIAGVVCPLTTLENVLRQKAGQTGYAGDFLGYWVHAIIFFDARPWVFTACHIVFGLLVAMVFLLAPPRWPGRK